MASADVPVTVSADVRAELWSKLLVNCAYNAISALAQQPYGRMAALPEIVQLQRAVVHEVVAVAHAEGRGAVAGRLDGGDGAHRRRHAGAVFFHCARRGARQAQRDRPPQRHGGAAGRPTRHRHAGEPGAARAGRSWSRRRARARESPRDHEAPCTRGARWLLPAIDTAGVRAALHELGLADGHDALIGEPLTGGVSSDIWCIHTCARPAVRQARAAAAARRGAVAGADRTQPLRGALDAGGQRRGARQRAASCWASMPSSACW